MMSQDDAYQIHLEVHWPMASTGARLTAKNFAEAHRISRAYIQSVTEPLMVSANIVGKHQKRAIAGPPDHVLNQLRYLPS